MIAHLRLARHETSDQISKSRVRRFGEKRSNLRTRDLDIWRCAVKSPNARFGDSDFLHESQNTRFDIYFQISGHEIWRYVKLPSNLKTRDLEICKTRSNLVSGDFDIYANLAFGSSSFLPPCARSLRVGIKPANKHQIETEHT